MTDTTQPPAETLARAPLPCPFCGEKAHIEDGRNDRPWVIQCVNSECPAQPFMDHADTRREAVTAWNTRAALTRRAGGDAIPAGEVEPFAGEQAWDELVNVDDRTSPEEYPDMCLITRDELIDFMDRATPKPPAGGDAGAVRWRERWYGSDPQRGSAIVDEAGSLIAYFGGDAKTHDATTAAVAAHNAALALPAPVVEGDPETVPGRVIWHTSEEGGGPDVGISVGLGNGSALWIGELLDRDGGPVGIVFHGPGGVRHAARLSELDEVRDLFEHHVAPAIAALSEGRSHG